MTVAIESEDFWGANKSVRVDIFDNETTSQYLAGTLGIIGVKATSEDR